MPLGRSFPSEQAGLWFAHCEAPHIHIFARDFLTKRKASRKQCSLWSTEIPEWMKSWAAEPNFIGLEVWQRHRCSRWWSCAVCGPPTCTRTWIWNGKEGWVYLKGKLFFWTRLNIDANFSCFVINTWVSGSFSSPILSETDLHWPRAAFPSTWVS